MGNRQNNYDEEIGEIFGGEQSFQSPIYKDQSLVTVLTSYNILAKQIEAKKLPSVTVINRTVFPTFEKKVINTRKDLQLYPFTILKLENGGKFSETAVSQNLLRDWSMYVDDWTNSDIAEIEERHYLLLLGNRIYPCSMFMLRFWGRSLYGYSDKPKLEFRFPFK
jgi:hypothetical protein